MTKTAQIVLTGYDTLKIKESVSIIKKYSKTIDVKVVEDSTKVVIKAKSKLWGCEINDAQQKILSVTGSMGALQKIIDAKIKTGIYSELLLK